MNEVSETIQMAGGGFLPWVPTSPRECDHQQPIAGGAWRFAVLPDPGMLREAATTLLALAEQLESRRESVYERHFAEVSGDQ